MSDDRVIPATDLMVGDRVRDDFSAWAEVTTSEDVNHAVRIEWRLADGRREVTTYDRDDRFSLIDPDPWGPGGKFIESGLRPIDPDA